MIKRRAFFVVFLLSTSVACGREKGPAFTISMGSLADIYWILNSTEVREGLQLTSLEKTRMFDRMSSFNDSAEWRNVTAQLLARRSMAWDAEAYWRDVINGNDEDNIVRTVNEKVLLDVLGLLGERRYARFRQLYTQSLLRDGVFDSVITLNDLDVTPEQYATLHRVVAKKLRNSPRRDSTEWTRRSRYRAALRRLVEPNIGSESREFFGAEVPFVFQSPVSVDAEEEDSIGIELASLFTRPRIQQQLEMTVKQAREANEIFSNLMEERGKASRTIEQVESSEKRDRIARSFKESMLTKLEELFEQDQIPAFKRAACQFFIIQGELQDALRLGGISVQIEDEGEEWSLICAEAQYRNAVEDIRFGLEVLSEIVGERQAKRLCGKIVLPGTPWDISEDEEYLKKVHVLRDNIVRSLRGFNKPARSNPRRVE